MFLLSILKPNVSERQTYIHLGVGSLWGIRLLFTGNSFFSKTHGAHGTPHGLRRANRVPRSAADTNRLLLLEHVFCDTQSLDFLFEEGFHPGEIVGWNSSDRTIEAIVVFRRDVSEDL